MTSVCRKPRTETKLEIEVFFHLDNFQSDRKPLFQILCNIFYLIDLILCATIEQLPSKQLY